MRLNTGTAFCGSMGIGATNDTSNAYDVADMLGE